MLNSIKSNKYRFVSLFLIFSFSQSFSATKSEIDDFIPAPSIYVGTLQQYNEEFIQDVDGAQGLFHQQWVSDYKEGSFTTPSVAAVTKQEAVNALQALSLHEKPLPQPGQIYINNERQAVLKKKELIGAREQVAYVGTTQMDYVALDHKRSHPYHESFARAKEKDPKMGKGEYRRKDPHYDKVYDLKAGTLIKKPKKLKENELLLEAGHGDDFADTITYKGSNSSRDNRNFVPQNDYYNEAVRNPLVRHLIRPKKHGYKEVSIYSHISQRLDVDTPLPIGFVFIHYGSDGNITEGFYFPNLIPYKKLPEYLANRKGIYKRICDRYRLDASLISDLFGNSVIKDEITHRKVQNQNAFMGYRTLSGRFQVLPEGDTWDVASKNALIRTAAMLKMEFAAELDYRCLENRCALIRMFSDQGFRYLEFDDTLFEPERAAYWLKRVENTVFTGTSSIEDEILLLEIYQLLKERNFVYPLNSNIAETQLYFSQRINILEKQLVDHAVHENTIEGIYNLMNYFSQSDREVEVRKWNKHLDTVVCKAEINPEDRRRVAGWYLTGQESIPQNSYKSLKLFKSIMGLDFYKDNQDVIEDINKDISEAIRLIAADNVS